MLAQRSFSSTRASSSAPSAAAVSCSPCFSPFNASRCSKPVLGRRGQWQRLDAALKDTQLVPVQERGELTAYPAQPGVYAVYDIDGTLQYIGLSRKISASIANHLQQLPDLTNAVKFEVVEDASREGLTAAWKAWVEESVEAAGTIPPGNMPGETKWQSRTARVKQEIKLTAGKAINVPLETLIEQVVKGNKVVAFIKGTRTAPACGFSYKLLQILNETRVDFEVVNVLDEVYNPGLRDAIKSYSQWPTIPQLYVSSEFVGGADIVEQMAASGELVQLLKE